MIERIAKQKINVILVVDTSKSMQGKRIEQVNSSIKEIKDYLIDLEDENANIDFYLSILTFSTTAKWLTKREGESVKSITLPTIKTGGYSNIHLAYHELNEVMKKESQGGIMPDYGGIAPIVLLLTDGHPSKGNIKEEIALLKQKPWYNAALKYGIAIELNDDRTNKVLKEFVNEDGDVINVVDQNKLKNIIKIIVLTASKVKSSASKINNNNTPKPKRVNNKQNKVSNQNAQIKQEIKEALDEVDSWEW